MKTINRTVITIIPQKPYIDWANSFDDEGPKREETSKVVTSILIPDDYDELNFEVFLKKFYKGIFEEELSAWMNDPNVWPKERSYKVFNEWFDVFVSDAVFDFGKGKIVSEEY
jgi:hypothetical protein